MPMHEWGAQQCLDYAEAVRPLVRFDHARWARRITESLSELQPSATILEVAAGPAFLLAEIAKRTTSLCFIAQDQAEPMLEIARAELSRVGCEVQTVRCSAERLDLPDGSVDVALCKQLLHEAEDVDRTLSELRRVLKPDGKAFVIDFDRDGSRAAAFAVRTLLLVTGGRELARGFWRSFSARLRGADVRERMLRAGFASVSYTRSGFDYFLVGTAPALAMTP